MQNVMAGRRLYEIPVTDIQTSKQREAGARPGVGNAGAGAGRAGPLIWAAALALLAGFARWLSSVISR